MAINPDNISDIIRECAEQYILPRYRALEDHEISSKSGPRDLVTQADIDVEEHLSRVLPGILPGSRVVGEEGVSSGQVSLDLLQDKEGAYWVVDPVDGTYNFVHHGREFGVMLACVIGGETVFSWIYDVLGEDMAVSEKAGGAYIQGKKMAVRPVGNPADMSGHINPKFFPKAMREGIEQGRENFKSCISLHCSAHEYLNIAKGLAQFSIYSRQKPWDNLAGALMVEEAGGYMARWDGGRFTPQDREIGLIAAAGREDWQEAYDVFLKKYI